MITMHLIPHPPSRTGQVTGGEWADQASTTWNGRKFETRSARGASCELARELIAAGAPDGPWQCINEGGRRTIFGPSLHRLAKLTITSDGRFATWKPHPMAVMREAA